MIHVLLKGGLGNQMFQYAYALLLQQENKDAQVYVNGILRWWSSDKRLSALHHFVLNKGTCHCGVLRGVLLFIYFLFQISRKLGLLKTLRMVKLRKQTPNAIINELYDVGIYCMKDVYVAPPVRTTKGDKHLFGYFINPSVVVGMEGRLREVFTVKTEASKENLDILNEIKACNAVCLHVRRGDYSLFPQLQVCDDAYYAKAVLEACRVLENPVFYVFSTGHSDVEWVRQNYRFIPMQNARYVDLDNPDYEELRLMMACKHFIIANSTFSWWAAYLSDAAGADKLVWMPFEWQKGSDVQMGVEGWKVVK